MKINQRFDTTLVTLRLIYGRSVYTLSKYFRPSTAAAFKDPPDGGFRPQ